MMDKIHRESVQQLSTYNLKSLTMLGNAGKDYNYFGAKFVKRMRCFSLLPKRPDHASHKPPMGYHCM